MFPNIAQKTMKNGDENNNYMSNLNFNEKNISIGLPTPMTDIMKRKFLR